MASKWDKAHPKQRARIRKKWYEGNGALVQLKYRLKTKYGLTVDEYIQMIEAQGGLCAICSNPEPRGSLCVDHDHATGAIRGLLCHRCNTAVGLFQDSVEYCQAAADYLGGA